MRTPQRKAPADGEIEPTLDTGGHVWLTYKEAVKRARRAEISIRRWRREGLPMPSGTRERQRVRLVREDVLLAWWMDRMRSSPVRYYRLRRQAVEMGTPEPQPLACLIR